ncbi:hypothetical protein HK097_003066 [Rhizophlyctis rosea]|uniref:rRNA-processing protein n=1 Tax=Rhizophlyctis rosea TaxID=64517 RepID=A0AAD5X6A4_9FUNG|nr:hypothetical protein HK097_003066 [Rhizophlyctis rosea]
MAAVEAQPQATTDIEVLPDAPASPLEQSPSAEPTTEATSKKSDIPRGKTVSGRPWKAVQNKRHSSMRPKSVRPGWAKQVEERKQKQIVKAIQDEIIEAKKAEKEKKKQEAKEREERKKANEARGEVVQKVSAAKLKRMTKKQMRQLKKV